jgi:hypothetical protein
MNRQDIIQDIRLRKIDINNQELFFSHLIKGLMIKLNEDISIRGIPVPHMIIHTGSDALYLEKKGQDQSLEPFQTTNESYIYTIIPRCVVNPGGVDLVPDQLTNPYSIGQLQYDAGDNLYNLSGEFRRMPIKLSVELKYFTDSYRDLLELVQQILTKLAFIRTYQITYMGQIINCSYKIPESFSGEHLTELDGTTQDDKCHTLPLSLEIETSLPVYAPETIMLSDSIISKTQHNMNIGIRE